MDALESRRLDLQAGLDSAKTRAERNRLGQFATPTALARDLLAHARTLLPAGQAVRFLDPAIGTGAFYSALRAAFPETRIREARGFEIDPHYAAPAAALWSGTGLSLTPDDFTRQAPEPRFDLLICNPPYVRHHHMAAAEKARLQRLTLAASGARIGGLAGLYCYFLGLSHGWLADGAVSGWLIPSEFMDVNYGQAVKRYLLDRVTLLHIHRFDPGDAQFADALVSSAVVWFRNAPPPVDHAVTFSFGGTLAAPSQAKAIPAKALAAEAKWTRFPAADVRARSTVPTLSDFFTIRRGLATGNNGFFILDEAAIAARGLPPDCFRPILPGPRHVEADVIEADAAGVPMLRQRLFLLDTRLPEAEIRRLHPTLWTYLEEGKANGVHEGYLCSHRAPWYGQENRPPAPIVCTYLGRSDTGSGRPFRFLLNRSRATVANVYLALYPTPVLARALAGDPGLIRRVWETLNRIAPERLLSEGRVYGGGLHKLEPRELANLPVSELADLVPDDDPPARQTDLFASAAE